MRFRRQAASVASGVAVWASFAPGHLWPAAFIGIIGLLRVLSGRTFPGAIGYGFLFGVGWFAPLLWWAWTASGTPVAWLALVAFESLFPALLAVFWLGLARLGDEYGPWMRAIGLAATFAAMEQLRATWPFGGLPWGLLGFGQTNGPLLRLAPWGSTQLVAFVLVAASALFESALFSWRRRSWPSRLGAPAASVLMVVLPWFLPCASAGEGTVRAALVQGEVSRPDEPVEGSRSLAVTEGLRREASRLEPGSFDLLVLPESASDRDFRSDGEAGAIVADLAATAGTPVLLGTQHYGDGTRTNDYVLYADGMASQAYSKQHPVPFGEYVPARRVLRGLTAAVDAISIDMVPGTEPAVLDVPVRRGGTSRTVKVAVPICFEIGDGAIVDEAMRQGAELLVVPTSNAPFADTSESAQQFDITRFRAAQTGRTAIQVSTVGISGAVGPDGVVLARTGRWTSEHRIVEAGLSKRLTYSSRNCGQIEALALALGGVFAAVALMQGRLRPRTRKKGKP